MASSFDQSSWVARGASAATLALSSGDSFFDSYDPVCASPRSPAGSSGAGYSYVSEVPLVSQDSSLFSSGEGHAVDVKNDVSSGGFAVFDPAMCFAAPIELELPAGPLGEDEAAVALVAYGGSGSSGSSSGSVGARERAAAAAAAAAAALPPPVPLGAPLMWLQAKGAGTGRVKARVRAADGVASGASAADRHLASFDHAPACAPGSAYRLFSGGRCHSSCRVGGTKVSVLRGETCIKAQLRGLPYVGIVLSGDIASGTFRVLQHMPGRRTERLLASVKPAAAEDGGDKEQGEEEAKKKAVRVCVAPGVDAAFAVVLVAAAAEASARGALEAVAATASSSSSSGGNAAAAAAVAAAAAAMSKAAKQGGPAGGRAFAARKAGAAAPRALWPVAAAAPSPQSPAVSAEALLQQQQQRQQLWQAVQEYAADSTAAAAAAAALSPPQVQVQQLPRQPFDFSNGAFSTPPAPANLGHPPGLLPPPPPQGLVGSMCRPLMQAAAPQLQPQALSPLEVHMLQQRRAVLAGLELGDEAALQQQLAALALLQAPPAAGAGVGVGAPLYGGGGGAAAVPIPGALPMTGWAVHDETGGFW